MDTLRRLSDSELVAYIQRDDAQAFEEFVNRYSMRVFTLAHRVTKNREDAEDVMQEVFVIMNWGVNPQTPRAVKVTSQIRNTAERRCRRVARPYPMELSCTRLTARLTTGSLISARRVLLSALAIFE